VLEAMRGVEVAEEKSIRSKFQTTKDGHWKSVRMCECVNLREGVLLSYILSILDSAGAGRQPGRHPRLPHASLALSQALAERFESQISCTVLSLGNPIGRHAVGSRRQSSQSIVYSSTATFETGNGLQLSLPTWAHQIKMAGCTQMQMQDADADADADVDVDVDVIVDGDVKL